MSVTPQRPWGIWITIALAVVGGVVAAIIWFTSSEASDVDLTTADFAPADAGVYVALNTDLKSPQWVSAFSLVERLGEEDPEGQIEESAEEEGLDWDEDVTPFLGGNGAFYLRAFDIEMLVPSGAVVVQAKDADAAIAVIEREGGFDFQEDSYRDTPFRSDPAAGMWLAGIEGHLVLAMDEDAMLDVIEVVVGDQPSLAESAEFSALRDELSRNFLGLVYVNAEQLIQEFAGGEDLDALLEAAGVETALQPMAGVIGAESDGFTFQAASQATEQSDSPMLDARESRFASRVPGNTAVFVSTAGLADTLNQAIDAAGEELDPSWWQGTPYRDLDDAMEAIGNELGIDSARDLVDLFHGETALALWFPTGDEDEPEGLLLSEVRDEAAARDVIEALLANAGNVERTTINGVEVARVTDDEGDTFAFALDGRDLLIGSEEGVRSVLEGASSTLATASTYTDTLAALPTATGSFAFFDMATILRLTSGGIPADLDEAERALDGFILNIVDERGIARVSGTLTVE